MKRSIFKLSLGILNILLMYSCGIKKDPQPLPKPEFKLYRIGSKVYLVPLKDAIVPEGFKKEEGFFVKEEGQNFCFRVKHPEGKVALTCIPEAKLNKPSFGRVLTEDRLMLEFEREGRYRIYRYKGYLVPRIIKEVRGKSIVFDRKEEPYSVAVTKVEEGVESPPIVVQVPEKKPHPPPKPEKLRIIAKEGKLYLYWWTDSDEVKGFFVYRNGKLLTPKPIVQNLFIDELPNEESIYEVVSVGKKGLKSAPARITYKP